MDDIQKILFFHRLSPRLKIDKNRDLCENFENISTLASSLCFEIFKFDNLNTNIS